MRVLGWLAVLLGGFALLVGLSMDTTVAVDFGAGRVHNIGRINDRNAALLVGGVLLIVGVLVLMLGRKRPSSQTLAEPPATEYRRPCPHCAEKILPQAKVCHFCGHEVPAMQIAEHVDDRRLMNELGIRHEDGAYWFRDERHGKLRDAVMSARMTLAAERRSAS